MSAALRYDLIHEPWIPCECPDGSRVLVGIEEALTAAHTFSGVHDESPLVTATLHRLLLAILHRVFLPRTIEDWTSLWEMPSFDRTRVKAYLAKWAHRFDLFHPERPFLQVANLQEVLRTERGKDPESTAAWRLALERSAHSNATQLLESLPENASLSPPRAAAALLGFLAFTSGGRVQNETDSWPAASVRGGALTVIRGDTLNRTLVLNLVWQRERPSADVPPWERVAAAERRTRVPFGLVDQLVWQSRRVQLLAESHDGEVSVREVLTAAGERFDAEHPDPMFGYIVRDPKKPPMAVRIDRDRSVWRDAAALFDIATGAADFRRPLACNQLAALVQDGVVDRSRRFRIELFGLASNKAAIRLWRSERMPLPPSLLVDGQRVAILRAALHLAEDLGTVLQIKVLRVLAENALAPSQREAHAGDVASLREALGSMPSYWAELGQSFGPWLETLGAAGDLDAMLADWKQTLRRTAGDVVRNAELRLGGGARALQAGAKAQRVLRKELSDILGVVRAEPVAQADPASSTTSDPRGETA